MEDVVRVLIRLCDGDVECARRKWNETIEEEKTVTSAFISLLTELWAKEFIKHVIGKDVSVERSW